MKHTFCLIVLLLGVVVSTNAQYLTTLPNGGNSKASVSERIGLTDVTIQYHRPAVKGREGKIWGTLVPMGFTDPGFGSSKSSPWRAGANENTTISFSTPVTIEGKPLAAGTYGFFLAMEPGGATVIFSKNSNSWGAYFYNEKDDALRVPVKTVALAEPVERLKYEFFDEQEASAVIALLWEKLKVPFKVEVDYVAEQLNTYRRELQGNMGFRWEAWSEAAVFCLQRKVNLEEGLRWSDNAMSPLFGGQKNFTTLSTKASLLDALGRTAEKDAVMKEAMPLATMLELHGYGRGLIAAKRPKEALEALLMNAKKFPGVYTTTMGLVRGYSANGDFASALKYAKAALPLAPDKVNKDAVERFIKLLGEGKDVN